MIIIYLTRAVNARTKAHASELAAKQARADSEYARIRAREVAPDFVQPGEIKKLPEIILDIDRMSNGFAFQPQLMGLADPVTANNNISPNQYRKMQQQQQQKPPMNLQPDPFRAGNGPGGGGGPQDQYLNWQSSQQQSNYTPHSSTPPPQSMSRHSNTNINQTSQYFEPNLIIPSHQLQQQQNLPHPSNDHTGQKLNNDSKLKFIDYFFLSHRI